MNYTISSRETFDSQTSDGMKINEGRIIDVTFDGMESDDDIDKAIDILCELKNQED